MVCYMKGYHQKKYIMMKNKHGWFFFDSVDDMVDFYEEYELNPAPLYHFIREGGNKK